MSDRFDFFVVIAEMRTGSNFLETNLSEISGINCLGEAFNPNFVGYPKSDDILGITRDQREKTPFALLEVIRKQSGINGFRYFSDHDPRIRDEILSDVRCAKIILTRNPVQSFVSLQIAKATGQWKLTNAKHARTGQIEFDPVEFERYLSKSQEFQVEVLNSLQRSGQTAFYIDYDDLKDVSILNGLARFLGVDDRLEKLSSKLKKQNPASLKEKVVNFEAMEKATSRLDRFNLSRTPNFEPRRGPMVPNFVVAAKSPLLFMPIKSGPTKLVNQWLASLDRVEESAMMTGFSQKQLRNWMESNAGHRSFTVLRHPVARAHVAFYENFLKPGHSQFDSIKKTLNRDYDIDFTIDCETAAGIKTHRQDFMRFLGFLRENLSAQTSIRIDPAWATQQNLLQSMSAFCLPDVIIREDTINEELSILAGQVGVSDAPVISSIEEDQTRLLQQIYDADVEAATRKAYRRDYLNFGFTGWKP